jgi:hypothetical protein
MSVKYQTPSISVETKKTNNSVETKKTNNNREHAVVGVRGWLSQPTLVSWLSDDLRI